MTIPMHNDGFSNARIKSEKISSRSGARAKLIPTVRGVVCATALAGASVVTVLTNWQVVGSVVASVSTRGPAVRENFGERDRRASVSNSYVAEMPLGPPELISAIQSGVKMSVIDMARALNVSRQSVYDWQRGSDASADNLHRLYNLYSACEVFMSEHVLPSPSQLRRPIGGVSFLDRISRGDTGKNVALSLIAVLRKEARQAEMLRSRLAQRQITQNAPMELGLPHLDERA